jgi:hypothetical protein
MHATGPKVHGLKPGFRSKSTVNQIYSESCEQVPNSSHVTGISQNIYVAYSVAVSLEASQTFWNMRNFTVIN